VGHRAFANSLLPTTAPQKHAATNTLTVKVIKQSEMMEVIEQAPASPQPSPVIVQQRAVEDIQAY